jgi:hypothetical protein
MAMPIGDAEALTWPDDGPAVTHEPGGRCPAYRKPTVTTLHVAGPIMARGDVTIHFAFTEGGQLVSHELELSQDDLFRALLGAGVLRRRVCRGE